MIRFWNMSFVIAGLVTLDQITKWIIRQNFFLGESIPVIEGFFSLTYIRNPGAAFGLFAISPDLVRLLLLFIFPVMASIWLAYLVWHTRRKNFIQNLAFSLILAGAVGNLIDRFTFNYVVDFLDFYYKNSHFPAFNVADSSISVGGAFLFLDLILQARIKETPEADTQKN